MLPSRRHAAAGGISTFPSRAQRHPGEFQNRQMQSTDCSERPRKKNRAASAPPYPTNRPIVSPATQGSDPAASPLAVPTGSLGSDDRSGAGVFSGRLQQHPWTDRCAWQQQAEECAQAVDCISQPGTPVRPAAIEQLP